MSDMEVTTLEFIIISSGSPWVERPKQDIQSCIRDVNCSREKHISPCLQTQRSRPGESVRPERERERDANDGWMAWRINEARAI